MSRNKLYFAEDKDGNKMFPDAEMPFYATKLACGFDFKCAKEVEIPPFKLGEKPVLVHTGIKAECAEDCFLMIANRSSGPKRGLVVANGVGFIDGDYYGNQSNDGEIMFAYYNVTNKPITIEVGERIGQGVFFKFERDEDLEVASASSREGGFGSTGV